MPVDELRTLMAIALSGLLLFVRLDAPRFGSAEYDVEESAGGRLTRFAWPLLAIVLVAAIAALLPAGPGALGLGTDAGFAPGSLILAVLGSGAGIAAVIVVARLRAADWPPRLNPRGEVPRYAFDAVATAIVDELTFRGVLLGLLLLAGVPGAVAFALQLLLYGLETRLGRSWVTIDLLAEALLLGALTGALALVTGSVVAPLVAHASTRFAALYLADAIPPLLPRDAR
jgi:Type II CAAX prenyl endopeptidase Rce1-like